MGQWGNEAMGQWGNTITCLAGPVSDAARKGKAHEAFLQAAGEGAGPYAVEFSPGTGQDLIEISAGADVNTMREALRRYRRGDPRWRIG
jgi:hypothetical protein